MLTQSTYNRLLAVLLVAAPLAACSGGNEQNSGMAQDTLQTPAMGQSNATANQAPVRVTLDAKNNSGVTGDASLTTVGDSAIVDVRVQGATESGSFPAHIHTGTCDSPGPVQVPLTNLDVANGMGASTTSIKMSDVPQGQPLLIMVHKPSGQPIACGPLNMTGGAGGMNGMGADTMGMDTTGM